MVDGIPTRCIVGAISVSTRSLFSVVWTRWVVLIGLGLFD